MIFTTLLSAAALSSLAYAADIQVMVGASGNTYSQDSITAAVGDTVSFHFTGSRHDVVQAAFDAPCAPLSGGFQVTPQTSSDAVFTIAVTDTNPIFFYCSVSIHCQGGMVGAINPSSSQSLSAFKDKAGSAVSGSQPGGIAGGLLLQGSSTVGGSLATSPASGSSSSASGSSTGTASVSTRTSAIASSAGAASSTGGAASFATAAPAAFAMLAGAVAGLL